MDNNVLGGVVVNLQGLIGEERVMYYCTLGYFWVEGCDKRFMQRRRLAHALHTCLEESGTDSVSGVRGVFRHHSLKRRN